MAYKIFIETTLQDPMKTARLVKNLWLLSNIAFVAFYSLYILSWFFQIWFVENLPRFVINITIAFGYLLTLYSHKENFERVLENSNTFCFLYFMTNPPLVFMFPFYISSLVNTSNAIVSNKRLCKHSIAKYCFTVNSNQDKIILLAYSVELVMAPIVAASGLLGYSSFFSMVSYGLVIKISLKTDLMMRKACCYLVKFFDSRVANFPSDWQKVYDDFKKYMQVKQMVMDERFSK